jgi:hypothetical protein
MFWPYFGPLIVVSSLNLVKLGVKFKDLLDHILIMLDLRRNMSNNLGAVVTNPKLGVKLP